VTKGYLITAAKSSGPKLNNDQPFPRNTPDSVVFWLSGRKKGKPTLFAKGLDMKVYTVWRLGGCGIAAGGSDEARSVKAMWHGRVF
jgi:hypothetical protein